MLVVVFAIDLPQSWCFILSFLYLLLYKQFKVCDLTKAICCSTDLFAKSILSYNMKGLDCCHMNTSFTLSKCSTAFMILIASNCCHGYIETSRSGRNSHVMQLSLETLSYLDIKLLNDSGNQSLNNKFVQNFASWKTFDDFGRELQVEHKHNFRMTVSCKNLEKHKINFYQI